MKNTLLIILMAALFTGCDKDEQVQPDIPVVRYFLTMQIPLEQIDIQELEAIDIDTSYTHYPNSEGLSLTFITDRIRVVACRLYDGKIKQVNGVLDNRAFGIQNDSINICSYHQRVPVTYFITTK